MNPKLCVAICAVLFAGGFALALALLDGGGRQGASQLTVSVEPVAEKTWNAALGHPPRFTDVTESCGIDFRHENGLTGEYRYLEIMGAGAGAFDFDGDGLLDLYFVNGNRLLGEPSPEITNRLFRNLGGWKFADVTAEAGVGDPSYGQGCSAGDYDNDGDLDLYVSNFGPNLLYRNAGDGTFADVASRAGVADPGWGQTCSFLDYDGDGWLDLYVQNYLAPEAAQSRGAAILAGGRRLLDYPTPLSFRGSADRLYRNLEGAAFEDVTEAAGLLKPDGKGMGLACADFNEDGFLDIFCANDSQENYFFLGQKDGRFREAGALFGLAFNASGVPEASMGVDLGDYDGDGRMDLIVPCLRMQFFTLYRNLGEHFEDVSVAAGLAKGTAHATGFNANFLDYDNDGDLDLFFTCGGVRRNEGAGEGAGYNESYGIADILLAGDGRGRFTDVSARAGPYFGRRLIGRGSVAADLDNDGDLDLVVCNLAERAVILRNDTAGGRWIILELIDGRGRRNPPGARVTVEAGGRKQHALTHGKVTYLSQGDLRLHFGIGAAGKVDRLEVIWPTGARQVLTDLPADRLHVVREGR
jgi:hypothetical protein